VGAGGAAIAASVYRNWTQEELLNQIETHLDQYANLNSAT
jgi:hypothetical protein